MSATIRFVILALVIAAAGFAALHFSSDGVEGLVRRLPPSANASLAPQKNTCPLCFQSGTFLPAGDPSRPFAACPYCGSLERHRVLYLYLRQKTNLFTANLSLLHFSPETGLGSVLANRKTLNYATSWYEPDRAADYHLDLTRLALPDNSWDVLIAYHILEHVTEDRAAMREVFRVLKPGGWAALQVPTLERPDSYEDPTVVTEQQRTEKFGLFDHVRYYGWKDFADRLTQAGFEVTIERYAHQLSDSAIREFALDRNERIHIAQKPLR